MKAEGLGPRALPRSVHSHPTPVQPGQDWGAPALDTPRVMTPPLPAKKRPFCRGPEKQGVTPTIRVGAPRSCPSNLSLFTQPLNPELPAACGGRGVGGGQVPGDWEASSWAGAAGREVVLTGSLGLRPLAGRPPTKRVKGRGPPVPWSSGPGPSWLWAQTLSVTSWMRVFSQRTDTWRREGAGQPRGSRAPPPTSPLLTPHRMPPASPCTLAALDAELGPRAFRLSDEASMAQEEGQGGAAGRQGDGEEQEAAGGERADEHGQLGPGSQAGWSARGGPSPPAFPPTQPYQSPGGAGTPANSRWLDRGPPNR